ncbi:SPX domain-containing protein 1-like [Mangifera indica]|uniref:SPX domain-containing protein 1-like n=1 Tax=Mangifera indica TaxID=29780 RepID=UPI001CFC4458|nr:SPX domain-containing protein 1-like [Mangifera indica]
MFSYLTATDRLSSSIAGIFHRIFIIWTMKFWKSLSILIEETLPDWRDKFLSYKDLKKQLKLIHPKHGENSNKRPRLECPDGGACGKEAEETKRVNQFVKLLEDEMEKFNVFFVEKEEEYVIKWKELQDRVAKAKGSNEELMKVGREIVDFHGEMVLLENYSALNYTGLVKILKKYDKRSGALIRLPFIQKVLQQPFNTTDVLNKLVKECETMLDHLFSENEPSSLSESNEEKESFDPNTSTVNKERLLTVPKELSEIENMESMYMKLTLSALRVLKEIRSGSSTVSMFSLPPLQSNTLEKDWKKVPVLEQAAK